MYIGVLSGTSLDAIDVIAVTFNCNIPEIVATQTFPIPTHIKQACLAISETGICNIDALGQLDVNIGQLFATAILKLLKKYNLNSRLVKAIGSHGINIRHRPDLHPPFSMQIGDPNIISEATQIPTISDFRRRDVASGGQGAPLAPVLHQNVFRSSKEDRVIVNIGGIANATFLPAIPTKPVIGFDLGAGNCLMDAWCQKYFNQAFDPNGSIAKSGQIVEILFNTLLDDQYYRLPYPKSTGREYFNLDWLKQKLHIVKQQFPNLELSKQNVLRTLLELTAANITLNIRTIMPKASVYICGGGASNTFLLEVLGSQLKRHVTSTESLGIQPDWVEAVLFAWMAKCHVEGIQLNLTNITGGKAYFPLGARYG